MATARDIMNPNVEIIQRSASCLDAVCRMNDTRVSALIVDRLNPRDTFGIITMSDIVGKVVAKGDSLSKTHIHEVMTKPLIVILPGLSVKHVARLLAQNGISRAPVIDNNEIAGIITLHDILADPHLVDQMT